MLRSAEIKNFRTCEDVRVADMGQVVALVGRNGAGKTNILHAIRLSCAAAIATNPDEFLGSDWISDYPGQVKSTLEFSAEGQLYRYIISAERVNGPRILHGIRFQESLYEKTGDSTFNIFEREGTSVRVRERNVPIEIGTFSPAMPALISVLPPSDPLVDRLKVIIRFLRTIRYYSLDENQGPQSTNIAGRDYQAWLTKYEADGDPRESLLFKLIYLKTKREPDFDVLKELMGSNGLGLLDDIDVSTLDRPEIRPALNYDGVEPVYFVRFLPTRLLLTGIHYRVSATELSAGTRRILRILVALIFDRSSAILLEQPEDSLHPGLTKKLIGLLRQNALDTQLIFSSHSPALLNTLKPEEIRIVSLEKGMTKVKQFTPNELKMAENFMNDEGTLYDFIETEDQEP